jgi:hypothetical protein
VVLILSEAFIDSSWCNFEAEYTLSLKLDMKESKTIIPLYTDVYSFMLSHLELLSLSMKVTKWYSLSLAREGGSVSCFRCLISVFSPSISWG